MSNETPPPASDRDAELAAALAVPALDERTRRALVDSALAHAHDEVADTDPGAHDLPLRRPGRMATVLGLAAAVVIGAVVGAAIVNQPDDQGPHQAAAPTTAVDERAKTASPDAAGDLESAPEAPAGSSAPPVDLGDLGPVVGASGIRAAVTARLEAGTGTTPATVPCLNPSSNAAAGIYGLVVISAAGTATLEGETVVVLVGPTTQGDEVAVVLDASRGCAFIRNVDL